MIVDRYSRGLVPTNPESLRDFIDTELLKLERIIDAIREVLQDHEDRLTAGGL